MQERSLEADPIISDKTKSIKLWVTFIQSTVAPFKDSTPQCKIFDNAGQIRVFKG